MKLLIAVPSKGRSSTITRNTMRYAADCGHPCKVFVEPQEADAYASVLGRDSIVVLDANNKGLGYAKVAIASYAEANGYDLVFKIDDDIQYWSPGHDHPEDNIRNTPMLLQETLALIIRKLTEQPLIKGVGFNYKPFMHIGSEPRLWLPNQRLQGAYVCRTDSLYAREEISTFEDFATTLTIWAHGGLTLRYTRAGMYLAGATIVAAYEGGLQMFDRAAMAEREIALLREVFPMLKTKRVDRPWKVEPDMANAARQIKSRYTQQVPNG